jgi:hypothetical protein
MTYGVVVLADTEPRARKEHKCQLCERTIERGETYTAQRNIFDGRLYTFKACRQCMAFSSALHKAGFDDDEGGYPWPSELDASEIASVGLSREHNLFRARWRDAEGALVEYPGTHVIG